MAPESAIERSPAPLLRKNKFETILIIIILMLAVFSRFYDLGARVMSHDEVNHVVPSFELYSGQGYVHDPVTHGPFQFHIVALTYFILGDNDFSSRVPAALFSVAAIVFVIFGFRRYLGRTGALIAGILFLISPYMLFYGRYTRNEGFIELWACLQLYAVLRYMDKGGKGTLLFLAAILSLQICTKETAYIYAAILLLFLGFYFLWQLLKVRWVPNAKLIPFLIYLFTAGITGGLVVFCYLIIKKASVLTVPTTTWYLQSIGRLGFSPIQLLFVLAFLACLTMIILLALLLKTNLHPSEKSAHRTLDLLILVGTLVLPLLAAFPIRMLGWNPLDYTLVGRLHTGIMFVLICIPAIILGTMWDWQVWLQSAGIFFGIFTVLYTTFFTNGNGFFTGLVGSLGYWLEQQGVNRGGQPVYYYALVQIPFYEFLAALGMILGIYFAIRYWRFSTIPGSSPAVQPEDRKEIKPKTKNSTKPSVRKTNKTVVLTEDKPIRLPVFGLLVFWSVVSLVAYSIAGEKMPWLTVHITFSMLLAAGWGLGFLADSTPWKKLSGGKMTLGIILIPILLFSLAAFLTSVLGDKLPFQGNTLEQLQNTSTFLFSTISLVLSFMGLFFCFAGKPFGLIFRLFTVVFFTFLALVTIRTSIRASFINYDNAKEFLVYAHAARGPKDMLVQIEEISERLTKGLDIQIGYDNDSLYPYWWYLRNYPNAHYFADEPTREIASYDVVVAGEANWSKVDPLLSKDFISYDYMRLWWPTEEYRDLSWARIKTLITDSSMRQAVFNIWWDRDYAQYAALTGKQSFTLENWQPNNRIRLYIRKDVVARIWEYGVLPSEGTTIVTDPYAADMQILTADLVIGGAGSQAGQFNAPRGVAIAPDGSLYVADSRNHRIQHLSSDGVLLESWGTYADLSQGNLAPGGTFNEPWGVAVAPDGSVFVTDTWNHRIQKFSADGNFIQMWGIFSQDGSPVSFYGPRGITVDHNGRIFVTDTGNKRVVVFDLQGNYITEFGSLGTQLGELDEPVGIAVDPAGKVYVADTWNRRIQVFEPDTSGLYYTAVSSWPIDGWSSTTTENKPFITVDDLGHVFVTDPEQFRVLEFTSTGTYLRGWGGYSPSSDGFGLPVGLSVDPEGRVWVTDAVNNVLLRFSLPPLPEEIRPLPDVPYGAEGLSYSAEDRGLFDMNGSKVYSLDEPSWSWMPVVPDELAQNLPVGMAPIAEQLTTWVLTDAEQNPVYRWDLVSMQWLQISQSQGQMQTEEIPTSEIPVGMDCPFAPAKRLETGQMARALVKVNVRSEPLISVNGIASLYPGENVLITGEARCWQGATGNYLFWPVQLANGTTGWVAEGDLQKYYLEPMQ